MDGEFRRTDIVHNRMGHFLTFTQDKVEKQTLCTIEWDTF